MKWRYIQFSACFIYKATGSKSFIPNPENKPQINHKNGKKSDNNIKNLEWCTALENIIHGWRTGLYKITNNKAIIQINLNGEEIERFNSIGTAAKKMNVCISSISNALLGYSKTSGGYIWKYQN